MSERQRDRSSVRKPASREQVFLKPMRPPPYRSMNGGYRSDHSVRSGPALDGGRRRRHDSYSDQYSAVSSDCESSCICSDYGDTDYSVHDGDAYEIPVHWGSRPNFPKQVLPNPISCRLRYEQEHYHYNRKQRFTTRNVACQASLPPYAPDEYRLWSYSPKEPGYVDGRRRVDKIIYPQVGRRSVLEQDDLFGRLKVGESNEKNLDSTHCGNLRNRNFRHLITLSGHDYDTGSLKSTAPNLNVPNGNSGAMKANIESSSDSKKRWTKFDLVKCRYCMTADLPSGHGLYNMDGDVVCPVLSKYQCPFCNATGTKAHTLKYCPQNPILRGDINNIKKLPKGAAPDYHRLEAFRLRHPKTHCKFCEEKGFQCDHPFRDPDGGIACPVLSRQACPICGATGRLAHTYPYCPVYKDRMRGTLDPLLADLMKEKFTHTLGGDIEPLGNSELPQNKRPIQACPAEEKCEKVPNSSDDLFSSENSKVSSSENPEKQSDVDKCVFNNKNKDQILTLEKEQECFRIDENKVPRCEPSEPAGRISPDLNKILFELCDNLFEEIAPNSTLCELLARFGSKSSDTYNLKEEIQNAECGHFPGSLDQMHELYSIVLTNPDAVNGLAEKLRLCDADDNNNCVQKQCIADSGVANPQIEMLMVQQAEACPEPEPLHVQGAEACPEPEPLHVQGAEACQEPEPLHVQGAKACPEPEPLNVKRVDAEV